MKKKEARRANKDFKMENERINYNGLKKGLLEAVESAHKEEHVWDIIPSLERLTELIYHFIKNCDSLSCEEREEIDFYLRNVFDYIDSRTAVLRTKDFAHRMSLDIKASKLE